MTTTLTDSAFLQACRGEQPAHTGGVLFGVGWGIAGFCPGPALVAMGSGLGSAWVFGLAMLAGMALHDRWLAPR